MLGWTVLRRLSFLAKELLLAVVVLVRSEPCLWRAELLLVFFYVVGCPS